MKHSLSILMIEDDVSACNEMQKCIEKYEGLKLAGITNNSHEALELMRFHLPNVVVLDLELHHGGGNGLLFLSELKQIQLESPPYILITTNNMSDVTLEQARQLGADFTLAKYEQGYCAQYVLDTIVLLKSAILKKNAHNPDLQDDSPAHMQQLLIKRIQRELDLIGINPSAVGYKYLVDSILLILNSQGTTANLARLLAPKYAKSEQSIERAMQNAIKQAWVTNDIEDLLKYYTAKIRADRGSPTLMEFVYYYATKIKNDIT